jgi:hypothetical protein
VADRENAIGVHDREGDVMSHAGFGLSRNQRGRRLFEEVCRRLGVEIEGVQYVDDGVHTL